MIYVWIYEKGVQNRAKLFRLTASNSQQSGQHGVSKPRGVAVKEGCGREPSVLATSWYQAGAPRALTQGGGVGQKGRYFGLKTGHFLCRTAFTQPAVQA